MAKIFKSYPLRGWCRWGYSGARVSRRCVTNLFRGGWWVETQWLLPLSLRIAFLSALSIINGSPWLPVRKVLGWKYSTYRLTAKSRILFYKLNGNWRKSVDLINRHHLLANVLVYKWWNETTVNTMFKKLCLVLTVCSAYLMWHILSMFRGW